MTSVNPIRRHGLLESKTSHPAVPYRLRGDGVRSMGESRWGDERYARAPSGNG